MLRTGSRTLTRPDHKNIDIADEYGIYRSLRCSSTTTTVNQGLNKDVIDANNR
jgi:hypothetical protein